MKKCKIEGCDYESKGLGFCNAHYQRFKKGMSMILDKPRPIYSTCKIEKCNRQSLNSEHNLCKAHYERYIDGKDINSPIREYKENCSIEWCKNKHFSNGYCKRHYLRLKRQERWEELIKLKGGKCQKCQNSYHFSSYDFHHRDPLQKDISISTILLNSIENIYKEVEKCDLLCANCHRELHFNLATNNIGIKRSKSISYE